jgi:alkylation response protein AidB-like acyl-CoA dehydrogenase
VGAKVDRHVRDAAVRQLVCDRTVVAVDDRPRARARVGAYDDRSELGREAQVSTPGLAAEWLERKHSLERRPGEAGSPNIDAATRLTPGGCDEAAIQEKELLAMTHAIQAVELACSLAGASAIRAASPLERCFRDVQTMRHHVFASEARYATFGQVYLGVEPHFPVIAL